MSTARIVATSNYLHAVSEGTALPPLEARLNAVARERYRRIDRFIALAVLGSAECAARASLDPGCGLYLGSGIGPVGSNGQVQQQLCRDKMLPKPFSFVNTLGSAAGHYVAKNLRLEGQNFFVASRGDAFQVALEVALADLELGIVTQALVGAVEECALPLDVHRRRQGLPADAEVAEGSHWVLLDGRAGAAGPPVAFARCADDAALAQRVRAEEDRETAWVFASRAGAERRRTWDAALAGARRHAPALARHDSLDAAVVAQWLAERRSGALALLTPSGRAGTTCLRFGA